MGKVLPFPAPVAGVNTRDGVLALMPNEARVLVNWLPQGNTVTVRPGYSEQSDGAGASTVDTLDVWRGATGETLVAVGDGQIWDVSGGTASSIHNGSYTDNRFQTAMFNGYLFGVNGTETPWRYDGSSHSVTGFTGSGLTIANLINIEVVRNRLWLCEKQSLDVWYGGIGSITGALTKFQTSQLLSGGYMMAIASWSRDAGDGMDDLTVFISSIGEVLVYAGDPASTFSLIGKYQMPRPIGRDCTVKIGGQLAVLTEGGLIPLDAAMKGLAFDPLQLGPFGKTAPSIKADHDLYGSNAGWETHMVGPLVYVNIPIISGSTAKQYIYNTQNGAWTNYEGLPIQSMTEYDGDLYFGGAAGKVWKHTGQNDNGDQIVLTARQAFQGTGAVQSLQATSIRVDMSPQGDVSGKLGVDVDGISRPVTTPVTTISEASNITPWGSAWGSNWNQKVAQEALWFSTEGYGRSIAPALVVYADAQNIDWYGTQVMVQEGSIL